MSDSLFIEKKPKQEESKAKPAISKEKAEHMRKIQALSLAKRRENARLKKEGKLPVATAPDAAPVVAPVVTPSPAPVQVPTINREEMINNKLLEIQKKIEKSVEDNIKNYFNAHIAKLQAPKQPPQQNIQAVIEKKVEQPKPVLPPQPQPQRLVQPPPPQPSPLRQSAALPRQAAPVVAPAVHFYNQGLYKPIV